jgi:hypothetical protein
VAHAPHHQSRRGTGRCSAIAIDRVSRCVDQRFSPARLPRHAILGHGADFEAEKSGRVALIASSCCKAAQHGIAPFRKVQAAADSRGAQGCIYIALNAVSDNARPFAVTSTIDIVPGVRLAQLMTPA